MRFRGTINRFKAERILFHFSSRFTISLDSILAALWQGHSSISFSPFSTTFSMFCERTPTATPKEILVFKCLTLYLIWCDQMQWSLSIWLAILSVIPADTVRLYADVHRLLSILNR